MSVRAKKGDKGGKGRKAENGVGSGSGKKPLCFVASEYTVVIQNPLRGMLILVSFDMKPMVIRVMVLILETPCHGKSSPGHARCAI